MPVVTPGWQWLPVAGPDPVPEAASDLVEGTGCRLIAARIRGKRHRHTGDYNDDWYTIGAQGDWTFVAVSDGAGSKPLARVGARLICETAIAFLTASPLDPASRLVAAATAARQASMLAAFDRGVPPAHLSATLLLVAFTPGTIAALQIGDGAILASGSGGIRQVGVPNTGAYAGETEFLVTYQGDLEANVTIDTEPADLVLLMTDGVADDYFPVGIGTRRLIADLTLNGILPGKAGPADDSVANVISGPNGPRSISVRSVEVFAQSVGVAVEDAYARLTSLVDDRTPDSRLLDWLEGYTVRGSFDDRTLAAIVMNP